ncbi:hypothetical protein [Krasilnikovia sp. MM14-A1004]
MSKKDTSQNLMWVLWALLGSGGLFILLLCGVVGLIIIVWTAITPGI